MNARRDGYSLFGNFIYKRSSSRDHSFIQFALVEAVKMSTKYNNL